ncbi:MAG: hypothetical protein IJB83_05485 [Bacilli bacterium]|nr:hypothetical protein [Bacilli bacterium]
MKNKELLNICYKFFNRFITTDKLLEELTNIDTSNLPKKDIEEQNKLIEEIQIIAQNTPNEIDEYVIQEKEKIKNLINRFENIPKDDKNLDFLNKQLENLKKDYGKEIDSHERWFKIKDYINKNSYFNKVFESLTDYELLEFIAQNISAPFPPNLNQEEFDRLVNIGIEKDEREWLWRLAFNYENRSINFDSIVEYFIKKKDGYYLAELISAVGECLNIDKIIDMIYDKELIEDLEDRKSAISHYVSEEQLNRLISKLD